MRIFFYGCVIIAFFMNVACGTTATAGISISDLEGVWVPEHSLKTLQETLSPSAAGGAEIILEPARDGKSYKLQQTNLREGIRYDVLNLSPTKKTDVYKLQLSHDLGPEGRGAPWDYHIELGLDMRGVVANIIFIDGIVDSYDRNRVFVRIPVPWRCYVNRLVFTGIWTDETGKIFSFCECGQGQAPGGASFTYKVPLSLLTEGRDPVWILPPNALQAGANGYYFFERTKDELHFFYPSDFQHSGRTPAVILKRK